MSRRVRRFSCGAASAVATMLDLKAHPGGVVTRCRLGGEHEDNERMHADCQAWFGQEIIVRENTKYTDHMDVWEKERFIKQHGVGASCTGRLKREPWYDFDLPDDILVIGYTVEEQARADSLRVQNFEKTIVTPLIDAGLTKDDCLAIVQRAGIRLPTMYLLNYGNNNCLGCCKGGMGYWNKIRVDFPPVFERAARIQRGIGTNARFWIEKDGTPIMLDDLDPSRGNYPAEPEIDCSMLCYLAEQDIAA